MTKRDEIEVTASYLADAVTRTVNKAGGGWYEWLDKIT